MSYSSSSSSRRVAGVFCTCGEVARLQTSWTTNNPGRRYFDCAQNGCRFWNWFDPPMCARSKEIIPGLLSKINRLQAATNRHNAESATEFEDKDKEMYMKKIKKLDKEIAQLKKKTKVLVLLLVISIVWMLITN
ncbi:GRF zinc finger containing protein [Striga asiatica]|uniref:GRF zinc finger containing protein n=1 Tax=Striga asiatica TaxID=4170 RepID=A0A5A7Q7M5_STRAF|nr:GRF zinc finger containing protein [Striga asiatica]